jgi:hypothetical protein
MNPWSTICLGFGFNRFLPICNLPSAPDVVDPRNRTFWRDGGCGPSWLWLLLFMVMALVPCRLNAAGTWVPLTNRAPDNIDLLLLLSDGTVMAASGEPGAGGTGNAWYKLTPDADGSYLNGTWSTLAPMNYDRLYYASQVLRDGRVLVAGGEYGTGTNSAEVYNPWPTPGPSRHHRRRGRCDFTIPFPKPCRTATCWLPR